MGQARISDLSLDQSLCDLTTARKLQIKSRLYFYRNSLGSSQSAKSWTSIATDIITLPESNELSGLEKKILANRYRYYMSAISYKGREKPDAEQIKKAEFFFGEDSLYRWFAGAPSRNKNGQKSPYEPAPEIIAAVRDFLVIKGYVTEAELQTDEPSIALAFSLNDYIGFDCTGTENKVPRFLPVYHSVCFESGLLSVYTIIFDNFKETGRIQFHLEKNISQVHPSTDFSYAFENFTYTATKGTQIQTGWIPISLLPAMVSFSKSLQDTEKVSTLNHIVPSRIIEKNAVGIFDWRSLRSYETDANIVTEFRPDEHSQPFIHSAYENKLELFNDLCNTRIGSNYSSFDGEGYKFGMTFEKTKYTKEDMESGKALYDAVLKIVKIVNSDDHKKLKELDFNEPAQLIQQGASVNYWDPAKQTTTLHLAVGSVLRDTLDAMMNIEGLDYLIKDRNGRLPADLAFFSSSEYGPLLTEKQVSQASERGIEIPELIASGPGPQPV